MRLAIFFLFSFLISTTVSQAQISDLNWLQLFSGGSVKDMEVDDKGNIYIVANKGDSRTFALKNSKYDFEYQRVKECFVIKLNSKGKIQWVQPIKNFRAIDICLTNDGEIIISGNGQHTKTKKQTISKKGIYLLKIDKKGKVEIVAHRSKNPNNDANFFHAGYVDIDNKNIIYWSHLEINADWENTLASISAIDLKGNELDNFFEIKYKGYQNFAFLYCPSIVIDEKDNLFVYGSFLRNLTVNGDLYFSNSLYETTDSYFVKLDKNRKVLWKIQTGGQSAQYITDVTIRGDEVVIAGVYDTECFISSKVNIASQHKFRMGSNSFNYSISAKNGDINFAEFYNFEKDQPVFKISSIDFINDGNVFISGIFEKKVMLGNQVITPTLPKLHNAGFYGASNYGKISHLNSFWMATIPKVVRVSNDNVVIAGNFFSCNEQEVWGGFKIPGKEVFFKNMPFGPNGFVLSGKLADELLMEKKPEEKPALSLGAKKETIAKTTKENPNSNALSGTVQIFPNPVENIFNVHLKNLTGTTKFTLLSVRGKILFTSVSNLSKKENQVEIDISNLPSGIYFLKVENGNSHKSFKVIKK